MRDPFDIVQGDNTKKVLKGFVERIETLDEEIKATNEFKKEVLQEAKAVGFDTKTLREVIKRRKIDREERMERDDMIKVYEESIESLDDLLS